MLIWLSESDFPFDNDSIKIAGQAKLIDLSSLTTRIAVLDNPRFIPSNRSNSRASIALGNKAT